MFSQSTVKYFSVFYLFLTLSGNLYAQEGFPLDGTWHGERDIPAGDRKRIVLVMEWDGKNINGIINPGPKSVNFKSAVLHPETWSVHFEAVDADGVPIIIDGRLHDIGSYNRTIEGVWKQGGVISPFSIQRD